MRPRLLDASKAGTPVAVPSVASSPSTSSENAAPDGLTPREVDVLRHTAAGHSNTEIAAALYGSTATMETRVNHNFVKTACATAAPSWWTTPTRRPGHTDGDTVFPRPARSGC